MRAKSLKQRCPALFIKNIYHVNTIKSCASWSLRNYIVCAIEYKTLIFSICYLQIQRVIIKLSSIKLC